MNISKPNQVMQAIDVVVGKTSIGEITNLTGMDADAVEADIVEVFREALRIAVVGQGELSYWPTPLTLNGMVDAKDTVIPILKSYLQILNNNDDQTMSACSIDHPVLCEDISDKWAYRFLRLAKEYSTWSKDPSTKVAAVIAKGRDQLSLGYNGFIPSVPDDANLLADRTTRLAFTAHAEENAITKLDQVRLKGSTIYVTAPPCLRCARLIAMYGLSKCVYLEPSPGFQQRWHDDIVFMKRIFDYQGIKCIEVTDNHYQHLIKKYHNS